MTCKSGSKHIATLNQQWTRWFYKQRERERERKVRYTTNNSAELKGHNYHNQINPTAERMWAQVIDKMGVGGHPNCLQKTGEKCQHFRGEGDILLGKRCTNTRNTDWLLIHATTYSKGSKQGIRVKMNTSDKAGICPPTSLRYESISVQRMLASVWWRNQQIHIIVQEFSNASYMLRPHLRPSSGRWNMKDILHNLFEVWLTHVGGILCI